MNQHFWFHILNSHSLDLWGNYLQVYAVIIMTNKKLNISKMCEEKAVRARPSLHSFYKAASQIDMGNKDLELPSSSTTNLGWIKQHQ